MTSLPQTLGNYRIIAKLGQGGMARALLAMRIGPGGFRKLFVLKHLRPDLPGQSEFVEMFLDEARLAAMLSHRNVVQTHEIGRDENNCFISMDYLEGQSLGRVLRRVTRAQIPLSLHIHIIAEVLAGLHYAHELRDFDGTSLNVVHRDVSPGNVFLTYDGQVKLLDFGIAKAVGAHCQTEVGVLKGKLAYMAPEQAMSGELDRRADIFAVGVMLWEALARRRLVERGESEPVTLHSRVNGLWEPISKICPEAPPALLSACEKAMSREAVHRYVTAEDFRTDLIACLVASGSDPTREKLSELVSGNFATERDELAQTIAATIEAGGRPPTADIFSAKTPSFTEIPLDRDFPSTAPPQHPGPEMTVNQPEPRLWKKVAVASVAAAAVAVAVIVYAGSSSSERANAQATPAESANVAEVADEAAETAVKQPTVMAEIAIRLSLTPADATVSLDGEPFQGGESMVAKDDQQHQVVVSKPGYETDTRLVRFDGDLTLGIVLEPNDASTDETSPESPRVASREANRVMARRRAEQARRVAEAAREAAAVEAARAAKEKADAKPKRARAGDRLEAPKKKVAREIDKNNPYR